MNQKLTSKKLIKKIKLVINNKNGIYIRIRYTTTVQLVWRKRKWKCGMWQKKKIALLENKSMYVQIPFVAIAYCIFVGSFVSTVSHCYTPFLEQFW